MIKYMITSGKSEVASIIMSLQMLSSSCYLLRNFLRKKNSGASVGTIQVYIPCFLVISLCCFSRPGQIIMVHLNEVEKHLHVHHLRELEVHAASHGAGIPIFLQIDSHIIHRAHINRTCQCQAIKTLTLEGDIPL